MKISNGWISFSLINALALSAFAQTSEEPKEQIYNLDPYVITATKDWELSSDLTVDVDWLDESFLKTNQIHSLTEALQAISGISIVPQGSLGQNTSLFARGLESNHLQLQIDGRKLSPNAAGSFDWANIHFNNIRQVEIVQSPSATLQGEDAAGGVINLITHRGDEGSSGSFWAEAGSFRTLKGGFNARDSIGGVDYSLSFTGVETEQERPNSDYQNQSALIKLGWQTKAIYWDVLINGYTAESGVPSSLQFPTLDDKIEQTNVLVSPGMEWKLTDSLTLNTVLTYDRYRQDYNSVWFVNQLEISTRRIDTFLDWDSSENINLKLGAEAYRRDINQTGTQPFLAEHNSEAIYALFQSQWNDVNLSLSGRHQRYNVYENKSTGRIAGQYEITPRYKSTLAASNSYSVPTYIDLYFPGSSNPDLLPETITTFEWINIYRTDSLKLKATLFFNEIDDAIQYFGSAPENIAEAQTHGFEVSGKWFNENSYLQIGYTYVDAEDKTNDTRLLRRPRHTITASFSKSLTDRLTWAVKGSYLSDRVDSSLITFTPVKMDRIVHLDSTLTYQFNEVQFWIKANNLLNDRYEVTFGYPVTGFGLYGGFRIEW